MIERKTILDQTKGKITQILYSLCLQQTDHEIIHSVNHVCSTEESFKNDHDSWEQMGWQWYELYEILECKGCHTTSFRKMIWDSENPDESISEIFPSRLSTRKKIESIPGLGPIPSSIYKVYDEIFQARCNGQNILCGAGLRILLELICQELGAEGKNLHQYIDSLQKKNLCSSTDIEILRGVKLFGNEIIHEAVVDLNELEAAFDVLEHLLDAHFILIEKTEKLRNRVTEKQSITPQ